MFHQAGLVGYPVGYPDFLVFQVDYLVDYLGFLVFQVVGLGGCPGCQVCSYKTP
ncbi:MAG: hypothetical protein ACK4GU_04320 [Alishewanella aestuarii]